MKRTVAFVICLAMLATFTVFASAYTGENYVVFSNASDAKVPKNQHIAGDSNGDGAVNMLDILASLKYITGDRSSSLRDSIDTNSDGVVNLSDVLLIVRHVLGEKTNLGELVE